MNFVGLLISCKRMSPASLHQQSSGRHPSSVSRCCPGQGTHMAQAACGGTGGNQPPPKCHRDHPAHPAPMGLLHKQAPAQPPWAGLLQAASSAWQTVFITAIIRLLKRNLLLNGAMKEETPFVHWTFISYTIKWNTISITTNAVITAGASCSQGWGHVGAPGAAACSGTTPAPGARRDHGSGEQSQGPTAACRSLRSASTQGWVRRLQ